MSDVKVTIPRANYNPNQRTNIDVEVVNPDGTVSTKTVKGAVQATTQEDGSVSFGILASAHVPFGGAAASFEDTVVATTPSGFYRFKEASGATAANTSGAMGTVALNGTLDYEQTGIVPSDAGSKSILTNNTGEYMQTPAVSSTDDWSIMLAYRGTGTGSHSAKILLRDDTTLGGTFLRVDTTNFTVRLLGTDYSTSLLSSALKDGNDHLIIVSQDRDAGFNVYVDSSSSIASNTKDAALPASTVWLIGKNGSNAQYTYGNYSEFGYWSRALSSTEVGDIMGAWAA